LAAVFAVVIVAVARWRGLRRWSASWSRSGPDGLPAARASRRRTGGSRLAGGVGAILYAVIYLAHGVSLRTSAALLGTLASLLLAACCPGAQSNWRI